MMGISIQNKCLAIDNTIAASREFTLDKSFNKFTSATFPYNDISITLRLVITSYLKIYK